MLNIQTEHFHGVQRYACPKPVVQCYDLDDTLTIKPEGFDNTGMSKDDFFDASREFAPDEAVLYLLNLMHTWGDAIAICTARPIERLSQSWQWLVKHDIPFDWLIHSKGFEPSGISKQYMIKYLRPYYRRMGTLFDDSPYNVKGARLQKIGAVLLPKNADYWAANPEEVYKV